MTRAGDGGGGNRPAPAIWVGPGDRLRPLIHVLAGLGVAVRDIDDLAETATATGADDIEIVLDADLIPIEDVGYLKRFLGESGRSRVALVGDDAGTRIVRTILALPRARWMPWPPLLDDLIELSGIDVSAPPRVAIQRAAPRFVPPRAAELDAHEPAERSEIDEIQALMERDEREGPRGRAPAPKRPEPDARDSAPEVPPARATNNAQALEPGVGIFAPDSAPRAMGSDADESQIPPPWWRAQIADLADTAQRVELGVQALRMVEPDSHEEVREHVDQLDGEVARLVQFARTLGFVASPPARGDQVFDLGDTVQVFVTQLASRAEATPRCQFRSDQPVFVRSDRTLLGTAFDAFFWLAGACSAKGDLIRAQVVREGAPAEVRVEFPAGPLERIETARIVEPYGLRRVLPDLGPNALSAAAAIIVGQGGSVDLERVENARLAWRIVLPAVDPPSSRKKSK